jgi:hypothetical protein
MSGNPQILPAFNAHMFSTVCNLGLDIHDTSISVRYDDGIYSVRARAHHTNLEKIDNAARAFAQQFSPPLTLDFV